jgi:hypothetical protein
MSVGEVLVEIVKWGCFAPVAAFLVAVIVVRFLDSLDDQ